MAVTNGLALPIPELTDTADGPDAISDLANATEDYVFDRILPAGVTRYPGHHWGSGVALPTYAQGVRAGDSYYHTGLACLMRAVDPAATIPVWRQAALATVASLAARDAISTNYSGLLYPEFRVRQTDVGVTWSWTGTEWAAITLVRGKLWRTQGFSGGLANNTEYVVTMGASRVSGGFTTVPDALNIPYDGLYDLDWQGYVSGGVVGIVNFWVRRTHPGVADNIVGSAALNKTYAGVDSQGASTNKNVPLRAGNTLRLIVYQYAGPLTFYGTNEITGCSLTATYTGPLNGAAPV